MRYKKVITLKKYLFKSFTKETVFISVSLICIHSHTFMKTLKKISCRLIVLYSYVSKYKLTFRNFILLKNEI